MRVLVVGLILFVNFIIQSSLFKYIGVFSVRPDTALVIVVCLSFLRTDVEGAFMGLFAGLMKDLIFGRYIGYNALILASAGFFCGKWFKDYFRENYLSPLLLVSVSAFLSEFITFVVNFLLLGQTNTSYYLLKIILPSTLYTTLCVFPLYWVLLRVNDRLEKWEERRA